MPDRWFRVPRVGAGTMTDPYRPEFSDRCDGWSGQVLTNSPRYLIRAYADTTTLDGIEAEVNVTALTDEEINNALNSAFDSQNRNIGGWEHGFNVE